jgi:hypothetical protein
MHEGHASANFSVQDGESSLILQIPNCIPGSHDIRTAITQFNIPKKSRTQPYHICCNIPKTTMTKPTFHLFFFFFALLGSCDLVNAQEDCIADFATLTALQTARGNDVATPVTYVFCPNTVFVPTDVEFLDLNGNAKYLCGTSGASSNNCIVRGGFIQFLISVGSWDLADKDNILISGFTFEQCDVSNAVIAAPGRFTIRDCIFQVTFHHDISLLHDHHNSRTNSLDASLAGQRQSWGFRFRLLYPTGNGTPWIASAQSAGTTR